MYDIRGVFLCSTHVGGGADKERLKEVSGHDVSSDDEELEKAIAVSRQMSEDLQLQRAIKLSLEDK